MTRSKFVLGLLLSLGWCFAQTSAPQGSQASKAGSVSGRVFAITKGGDLKPARLATLDVYFLVSPRTAATEEQKETVVETAGKMWFEETSKALEEFAKHMDPGSEGSCLTHLLVYYAISKNVLDRLTKQKDDKLWRERTSIETDEEGYFIIPAMVPGEYIITASGNVGSNSAFWEADDIKIEAGGDTKVKLSSPVVACPIE